MKWLAICLRYFRPSILAEMTVAGVVQYLVKAFIDRVISKFFQRPMRAAEEKAEDLAVAVGLA